MYLFFVVKQSFFTIFVDITLLPNTYLCYY
jgi:hypothetical protein